MISYRATDKLVCECCRRVYDKDPFGSLLPYLGEWPDEGCSCGGEIEEGYECELCATVVPESEIIEDGERIYCPDCRAECAYCYKVIPTSMRCMSSEGYVCCPDCKAQESEAA